jgi:hypothetical protein
MGWFEFNLCEPAVEAQDSLCDAFGSKAYYETYTCIQNNMATILEAPSTKETC